MRRKDVRRAPAARALHRGDEASTFDTSIGSGRTSTVNVTTGRPACDPPAELGPPGKDATSRGLVDALRGEVLDPRNCGLRGEDVADGQQGTMPASFPILTFEPWSARKRRHVAITRSTTRAVAP
jgi:hypothetical protein